MPFLHHCLRSVYTFFAKRRTGRGGVMPARWFAVFAACVLVIGQGASVGHYTQAHIFAHGHDTVEHVQHAAATKLNQKLIGSSQDSTPNSHLIDCDLCGHSLGLTAAVTSTDCYRSFIAAFITLTYSHQQASSPLPYVFASPRAPPIRQFG